MGRESMLSNINKMLRITTDDNRELTGKLLVFDRHMNVVLGDTVEVRPQTKKMAKEGVESTRELGLILLRGEHVVSVTVIPSDKDREAAAEEEPSKNAFDNAPKLKKAMGVKRPREEDN
eukprot:gene10329-7223_t